MRHSSVLAVCAACLACSDAGVGLGGAVYSGEFSGPYVETFTVNRDGGVHTCLITFTVSGTITVDLQESGGSVTGEGRVEGNETPVGISGEPLCGPQAVGRKIDMDGVVTGSAADFRFSAQHVVNAPVPVTNGVAFVGALSDGVVTGTLRVSRSSGPHESGMTSVASTTLEVTLQ